MKIKRLIYCLMVTLTFLAISLAYGCSARTPIQGEARTIEKPKLYLVGMGPGDADLATVRAMEVIKGSDLIVCSERMKEKFGQYLKGKNIYKVSGGFWRYYGKDPSEFEGEERRKCEEITSKRNEFISKVWQEIRQGKTLAILDSGDPLIYGPWAWALEEFEDMEPVVVPGLSCFNAANAALRKNVTRTEHSKSVILTATYSPEKPDTIEKLSAHQATMVIFGGTMKLNELIQELSIHYPLHTPIAFVSHTGYSEKERIINGTLETILNKIKDEKKLKPYLVYVGDCLTYRCKPVKAPARKTKAGEKTKFYLIGMGPGDPDLATLRAIEVLRGTDLVVCKKDYREKFSSYLEGKELLDRGSHKLSHYYGKDCSKFKGKQREECNKCANKRKKLIKSIRRAIREGKTVTIMGCGDPFIYGPSVWFLEEFEDLNPVVVPGLSSFNAANAALKKGVTSGKHAKSVILTIPDRPDTSRKDTIKKLATHQATMVIFMPGVTRMKLKDLIEKFSVHYQPQTPIAIVVHAGYKEKERVIKGTLETILRKVGDEKLPFEHLIYVGDFLDQRMKKPH